MPQSCGLEGILGNRIDHSSAGCPRFRDALLSAVSVQREGIRHDCRRGKEEALGGPLMIR